MLRFSSKSNKSKKEQKRINITFRDNESEEELYEWIKNRGQICGVSGFIKMELNRLMQLEKERQEQKQGK